MAEPMTVIEMSVPPGQVGLLRRLMRAPGDQPSDDEVGGLRITVDELGDELAELRAALDEVKDDVTKLAAIDPVWRAVARAAWPEPEESCDGR
jgi:hypothetical protein